jgi:hypothetical protein
MAERNRRIRAGKRSVRRPFHGQIFGGKSSAVSTSPSSPTPSAQGVYFDGGIVSLSLPEIPSQHKSMIC